MWNKKELTIYPDEECKVDPDFNIKLLITEDDFDIVIQSPANPGVDHEIQSVGIPAAIKMRDFLIYALAGRDVL